MNVEHSDVRACTQDVYACFVKRLLRDHRQQNPQSVHILETEVDHVTLLVWRRSALSAIFFRPLALAESWFWRIFVDMDWVALNRNAQ